MSNILERLAGIIGNVVVAFVVATILALPGSAQDAKTVFTHSWLAGAQIVDGIESLGRGRPVVASSKDVPTIVRDKDNPDRLTILSNWWSHASGLGDGGAGCGTGFGLPTGSRIIVELISVKIISPTPLQGPYVAVGLSKTGSLGTDEATSSAIHIALQPQGQHYSASGAVYHYVAVQPVHLRIAMDDWICDVPYVGDFVQGATAHISYFGYILDPP